MSEQHTPGKWEARWSGSFNSIIVESKGAGIVAVISGRVDDEDEIVRLLDTEQGANARLVAASPTMYSYIQEKAGEGDKKAQEIIKSLD